MYDSWQATKEINEKNFGHDRDIVVFFFFFKEIAVGTKQRQLNNKSTFLCSGNGKRACMLMLILSTVFKPVVVSQVLLFLKL